MAMAYKKMGGLTLMEVLLVVAFLAVVFVPLLQMFSQSFIASSEAELSLKASTLAEKFMEEEKTLSFSNMASEAKAAVPGVSGFEKEIIVSEPNVNLKDVEIRIFYTVANSELTMTLKTLIANF
jgi:Tfp pilus assembly protein PilV